MSKGIKIGGLISGLLIAATLAVVTVFVLTRAEQSKEEIPVYGEVPDFQFVNQDSVAFGSEDLMGKITVLDFFFTRCQTVCPPMAIQKEKIYHAFDDTDDVQIVSVSVDPMHDVPSVLKEYGAQHGVNDQRWQFLHAPDIQMVVILSENGFMLPAENLPMGHSAKFVLIDRQGQIRGYYNSLEEKPMIKLREQIVELLDQGPEA